MHYDSGSYFPVVIEIRAVDCGIEQMQSTMASIEHATDQCATFVVKALKQKLIADGVVYLLQEIYGIENKEHDLGDENGSECIICMSDIRDTVILPCRHLCICNGCAETLRYKLNNCPICRSPFRALLQLKTMRVVSTVSITDQSPSSQQTRSQTRYETMTLVEALNGPISHIQSCVVPTAPLGYNIDSPHEVSTSLNSKVTRRSSRSSVAIQQEEEMSNGCSTSRCPGSPSDITYSSVPSHGRRYKRQQTTSPRYNRKGSIDNVVAQENAPIELVKNSDDIATEKNS
uniref:RING-type E3 ubiquitin transferase n=1 Tax=Elaeophora elaphi TaxID=1147741 RepID=A0A0R3RYS7_9BILA